MELTQKLQLFNNIFQKYDINSLFNFAKYEYSIFAKPKKVNYEPMFLSIEPTIKCNLSCEECANKHIYRKKDTMAYSDFRLILDKFRYVSKIFLMGAGEPLLNPDICEMIKHAVSRKILVYTVTNATVMDSKMSQNLMSSGLSEIYFSFDGVTKETYEKIRKGSDYTRTLNNIKTFIMLKNKGNYPIKTGVNFLMQDSNIDELSLMPNFISSIGIKHLNVLFPHDWAGLISRRYDLSEKLNHILSETKKEGIKNRVKVIFRPNLTGKKECLWPWRGCYITCDGHVTLCCVAGVDHKKFSYGNIFKSNIDEIWNSEKIQFFRDGLKKRNNSYCENCIMQP